MVNLDDFGFLVSLLIEDRSSEVVKEVDYDEEEVLTFSEVISSLSCELNVVLVFLEIVVDDKMAKKVS